MEENERNFTEKTINIIWTLQAEGYTRERETKQRVKIKARCSSTSQERGNQEKVIISRASKN